MPYRLLLLVVVVACIALLGLTGALLYTARHALQQGVTEMHQAELALRVPAGEEAPRTVIEDVRRHVVRAHTDFHTANDRLAPLAPVLPHLAWLPRIGDQLAVAPAAASMADQTADGVLDILRGLDPLVSAWHSGRVPVDVLVSRVTAGHPQFGRALTALRKAQRTREQVPGGQHERSVSSALQSLDRQLPRLLTISQMLALAPDFLGAQRPQSYLVIYQNAAELRATGGFIGSAGVLTVRRGHVSQQFQGSGIRDNLSVPPPEPVSLYNQEPGWLFRDSNWSPDFPTSAALERFFLKLDLRRDAEGVINVTPQAAADVLTATGPVYASEYRRWITGRNVTSLADYFAHWATRSGPYQLANADTRRKQFIGIVARHVFARLDALSPGQWLRLAQSIALAVEHRDILLNFKDARDQALINASGASGEMSRTTSDFLYVVDTNLSYNKINPYVHLRVRYQVDVQSDRWLQGSVSLQVKNGPTPSYLGREGIGPGAGSLGGPLDYATFLRIYVPAGAQLVDQSGWTQPWSSGPAYGKTMFCGYLIVPHGKTRTVHLQYVVPPNVFAWSHGSRYRLLVPHQPGSHPDGFQVSVVRDGERSSWTVARPTLDWTRTIPVAPLPFHPIPLPRQPSAAVAPGHWIEPHAFLARPNPRGPFLNG